MSKLVKLARKEFLYLGLALAILFFSIPLMPSSIFFKPVYVILEGEDIIFQRDVLFPLSANWTQELERLLPLPTEARIDCYQSGLAHFEKRNGTPIIYKHNCVFGNETKEVWELRMCWEVRISQLYMRPVCITTKVDIEPSI